MKSPLIKQLLLKLLKVGVFIFSVTPLFAIAPVLNHEELQAPPPRIIRTCCSFGTDLNMVGIPFISRTDIISVEDLGDHHYMGNDSEGNGIIYTQKGGFIDLGHLRDCADWTAYLYNLILSNQMNTEEFKLDLGSEGGLKTLLLKPSLQLDPLEASHLAGKIAYDLSLWHEIATWFGASYIPMIPERYSSFSPEDLYSNLLGITIGILAIQSDMDYDIAMTYLITKTLTDLQTATSYNETYFAMEKVKDIWWTNEKRLPSKKILIRRYLDTDYILQPWLVPGLVNHQTPYPIKKPETSLSDYYELRIKLNHKFPMRLISATHNNRTITNEDFERFMSYIDRDEASPDVKITYRPVRSRKSDLH